MEAAKMLPQQEAAASAAEAPMQSSVNISTPRKPAKYIAFKSPNAPRLYTITRPPGTPVLNFSNQTPIRSSVNHPASFSGAGKGLYLPGIPEEEYPESPFFSSEFQIGLINGLAVAKSAVNILSEIVSHQEAGGKTRESSEETARHLNGLHGASHFRPSSTKTIGFLGDSGEGKSSIINSLLDYPGLAPTGSMGACTSIVTEYRQKEENQSKPIKIEVDYFSGTFINDHIKELLWSFRCIFLPAATDSADNGADMKNIISQSNQAWASLKTAFGHEKGFSREFLGDQSERAFDRIFDQLCHWAATIPWPQEGSNGKWATYAESAAECQDKTRQFMRDRLWPFTKIIRVYIDAPIVRMGLILVDLPGLVDVNLARVKATQDYISRVDNIFAVANISRATTNQSLQSSLSVALSHHAPQQWEGQRRAGLGISVICTKSEANIKGMSFGELQEFKTVAQSSESESLGDLDKKIDRAKKMNNASLKKQLKRQREAVLMDIRNLHVRKILQSSHAERSKDSYLHVFCVSNAWYEKYKEEKHIESSHRLVTASGIPELRKFCYGLVTDSRLDEAKHFLQSQLPGLMSSLSIYSKPEYPAPVKYYADALTESDEIRETILEDIEHLRKELHHDIELNIVQYMEQRNSDWQTAAAERGSEWTKWPWTDYRKWCYAIGNNLDQDGKSVNWNSELIWRMRAELDIQWDMLEDKIPHIFEEQISCSFAGLKSLQSFLDSQDYPLPMLNSILHRAQDFKVSVRASQRRFEAELRSIRTLALGSNDSSYILQEMYSSYREAASYEGPYPETAIKEIVQSQIETGTIFPSIRRAIHHAISSAIDSCFDQISLGMKSIFSQMNMDINAFTSHMNLYREGELQKDREEEKWLEQIGLRLRALGEQLETAQKQVSSF